MTHKTTTTLLALALALAPLSIPARAGAADDAAVLVDEGKVFFKERDFARAHAKFRAAADADPKHPTALYNAALAARKGGLLEEARIAYGQLLARSPGDLDAVYGLAETERALAHPEAARALYERYVREEKRPERQDLVEKSRAAIAALPTPTTATATPTLDRAAAASPADVAAAQKLFDEGLALLKLERFDEAAKRFLAAFDKDGARFDALLKGAMSLRKANALDASKQAYERVLSSSTAKSVHRWDAFYGLAETERLRGDKLRAADLFETYAREEQRATEERYVRRARELVLLLRAPAIVPPPAPAGGPPAPPAPPPETTTPVTTTTTLPPPAPVPAPAPAPLPAPPPATVAFFGDALVVDDLLAQAQAAETRGDGAAANELQARARALAPDDPRLKPATPVEAAACDLERLLARGEVALSNGNAAEAITAFRRARACDPARAAPLWGLSRAFDVVGAKTQARHHAALYARSTAPDRDPTSASKAAWRAEQP